MCHEEEKKKTHVPMFHVPMTLEKHLSVGNFFRVFQGTKRVFH